MVHPPFNAVLSDFFLYVPVIEYLSFFSICLFFWIWLACQGFFRIQNNRKWQSRAMQEKMYFRPACPVCVFSTWVRIIPVTKESSRYHWRLSSEGKDKMGGRETGKQGDPPACLHVFTDISLPASCYMVDGHKRDETLDNPHTSGGVYGSREHRP
jgi:hypothetical protein